VVGSFFQAAMEELGVARISGFFTRVEVLAVVVVELLLLVLKVGILAEVVMKVAAGVGRFLNRASLVLTVDTHLHRIGGVYWMRSRGNAIGWGILIVERTLFVALFCWLRKEQAHLVIGQLHRLIIHFSRQMILLIGLVRQPRAECGLRLFVSIQEGRCARHYWPCRVYER
jgi:hypothetical protein